MTLQAIKYSRGNLEILDQLRLPSETVYIPIPDTEAAWHAIKNMQVRGAPAIAMVGCLGLAVELASLKPTDLGELTGWVEKKLEYLVTARPTAVNMAQAAHTLTALVQALAAGGATVAEVVAKLLGRIEGMLEEDIAVNKRMGQHGAAHILGRCQGPVRMLTHCNTGSLATAGYGTALGVIRSLREQDKLDHVYCTETRPYNQGARLTAFELVFEKMPATLICDSMAAILMERRNISAVVVGADRVVANGDTANKVGTYQLAIAAKYHGVPFYVACPLTTFDPSLSSGKDIVIEERPAQELTMVKGIRIAADGINCWNPAFDVTPADLITGGVITEYGVFAPSQLKKELQQYVESK